MSVQMDTQANFCPQCGAELETSYNIALSETIQAEGVYCDDDGHVVVDGDTVRIYTHEGGSE